MRALVLLSLFSIAAAKPGGFLGGWGDPHGISSLSYVQQPVVAQQYVAQPVVHAAPIVHAPLAIAKPAATSYSSFQRVIHPVAVSQPVVHAPVISQPIVHAPVIQHYQQPIVQSYAQPVVSKFVSVGSYGHGW